jgi:hypothetical protein
VFQFDATGQLKVARPLLVDWRCSSYTLGTTVGDGTNTSAVQTVQVIIPNRVRLCLLNRTLEVPGVAAPALILFGALSGPVNRRPGESRVTTRGRRNRRPLARSCLRRLDSIR